MVTSPLLIRAASTSTATPLAAAAVNTVAAARAGPSSYPKAPTSNLSPPPGSSKHLSTSAFGHRSSPSLWLCPQASPAIRAPRRSFHTTPATLASVKDPYAALGVKRTATNKEIKSAYYDLAKKHHPDRNKDKSDKAKEKFVEVQQAYDMIGDETKRKNFDQFGAPDDQPGGGGFGGFGGGNPFGAGGPFGGAGGGSFGGFGGFGGGQTTGNASDIFESLFGSFGGGGGAGGRARGAGFAGQSRGDDLETTIAISFEEACRGANRTLTINPIEKCGTCSGAGLKKGAKKSTCGVCNGTGTRTFVIQSGFQMASTCPACGGAGSSVAAGDACGSCDGVGRVRSKKTVQVKVPAGVEDGARIRLDGSGDAPMEGDGPSGCLYVRINVRPSQIWRRQGSNLHYGAKVPLHVAILGGKVRVPTLDGDVDVRVPAGTQVGDEMLLRGRGVPSLMRRGDKGDLLVGFEVSIPRSLTKKQKEILQMYADDVEGKVTPPPKSSPTSTTTKKPSPQASAAAGSSPTASQSNSTTGTSSYDSSASSSGGGFLGSLWKKITGS